jgi:hypothetical protein
MMASLSPRFRTECPSITSSGGEALENHKTIKKTLGPGS